MNEVLKMPVSNVNILGLRKGQAELFKYICNCSDANIQVSLHDVAIIYYTHTKKTVTIHVGWDGEKHQYTNISSLVYYNEKIIKKGFDYPYLYHDVKTWLKMCLGSFVMRGLLVAIPKFKPEEINE